MSCCVSGAPCQRVMLHDSLDRDLGMKIQGRGLAGQEIRPRVQVIVSRRCADIASGTSPWR